MFTKEISDRYSNYFASEFSGGRLTGDAKHKLTELQSIGTKIGITVKKSSIASINLFKDIQNYITIHHNDIIIYEVHAESEYHYKDNYRGFLQKLGGKVFFFYMGQILKILLFLFSQYSKY